MGSHAGAWEPDILGIIRVIREIRVKNLCVRTKADMRNFPLTPFLESIKDDIPVRVRDYDRMILALQGGDDWTIERLGDVLLSLLVKNRDQQGKFLRRFDAFFPPGAQTVLDDREIKRVIKNIKFLIETPKQSEPADIPSKKIVPEIKPESLGSLLNTSS